jgi:hypothetical protein
MKALILASLLAACATAQAVETYSGELKTPRNPGGSALATNQWDKGGFSLTWTVTQRDDDVFSYEYLLRAASPIYDFIVETGLLSQDDLLPGTTDHWTFGTFGPEHTDLTLPDTITGMKTIFTDGRNTQSVNIVTHSTPEWGNFFSYGEHPDKPLIMVIPTGAWNSGFKFDPPEYVRGVDQWGYLPVPSSDERAAVPEPVMGIGVFFIGLFFAGMKKDSRNTRWNE